MLSTKIVEILPPSPLKPTKFDFKNHFSKSTQHRIMHSINSISFKKKRLLLKHTAPFFAFDHSSPLVSILLRFRSLHSYAFQYIYLYPCLPSVVKYSGTCCSESKRDLHYKEGGIGIPFDRGFG